MKWIEEHRRLVGPGARLRVTLKAEGRAVPALDALQRAVEQGAVRDLQAIGQLPVGHGKAVVLAGDHYPPAAQVLHRVVGAVVAELHFHRSGAARQGQQLMAQADTEQGYARLEQFADRGDGVVTGLGIAGAVGQENTVGLHRQDLAGRRLRRHHGEVKPRSASMRRILRLTPKS
jgi:hypothetical protein